LSLLLGRLTEFLLEDRIVSRGKTVDAAWGGFIDLLRACFIAGVALVGLTSMDENTIAGLLTIVIALFLVVVWQLGALLRTLRSPRQLPPEVTDGTAEVSQA